jgi:ribonucleoside-diphosphate reductase alpha chain/ribonucleoside-triphosphate reductase
MVNFNSSPTIKCTQCKFERGRPMINILIIGTKGCANCESTKDFAERNGLQYTYKLADDLEKEEKSELVQRARKNKIFSYPLVLIDNKITTVPEFKEIFTKYVLKRDGRRIEFARERIINAILAAMKEVDETDESVAEAIAAEIHEKIGKETSVEDIQDLVEKLLLKYEKDETARCYIAYRAEQKEKRKIPKVSNYEILDDDFISNYKHKDDPMPQVIGAFTYYRTYSRWMPEEKRRERWWETVRRAVEYNCKLMPTSKEEAQKLFDLIYNLKGFLSGRTFWVGHTPVSYKYPMSNYNCAFAVVDSLDVFPDMFLLLMLGSGFGFRIRRDDVAKLPKVRKDINIIHKYYEGVERSKREDVTSLIVEGSR